MMPAIVEIAADEGFFLMALFVGLRVSFFFAAFFLTGLFFAGFFLAAFFLTDFLPLFLGFFFAAFFDFFADFFLTGLRRLVAMRRQGSSRVVTGQPQHAFSENVALYLARTTPNREGSGKEIAVVPANISKRAEFGFQAGTPRSSEHSCRTDEPSTHLHHMLAVLVRQDLAHTGLWPRFAAGEPLGEGPHPDQFEDRVFSVESSDRIASDGIKNDA
jgi:hypothetical protein